MKKPTKTKKPTVAQINAKKVATVKKTQAAYNRTYKALDKAKKAHEKAEAELKTALAAL